MAASDEEGSVRTDQAESEESEGNASGGSRSGSSSERSRSRSRDPDVSAAPLEEDSNDAGGISALAIEAVIELSTYEAIDEVDEPDVVEMLGECDKLDVVNVADVVVFPPNSSLPPCNPRWKRCDRADVEESHEDESKGDIVVIPTELKVEEVGVPAEEPCSLDDLSASHHVSGYRNEPVETVFEKSSKLPELANDLEGRISLDAGCLGLLESGWADEPKADGDEVQARIPDSGGVWSAVCVLIVTAIVVGMEKQLNEELNILGQHTLKEPTTDAQATEGARSIAFDAEACPGDAEEDPGGLPIDKFSFAWFEDVEHDIYRRERGTISNEEIFKVIEETDLLVTGLIVDESRGSNGPEGLIPVGISVEEVLRTSSGVAVATESVWDVGWRWPARYFKRYLRLGKLTDVVDEGETCRALQTVEETGRHRSREYTGCVLRLDALAWTVTLIGWLDGIVQAFEEKRVPDRSISFEDPWALFGWVYFVEEDMARPGSRYEVVDALMCHE
ncbi:hypothetical protein F5887DRAFT_930679 [Amanita rubescens]|nr:hypothetical protein F5887DRAFT_930679 [Amanita rubescens]